jgi:hypothetical protein
MRSSVYSRSQSPWSAEDLLRWAVLAVAGAATAVAGWWEASGKVRFDSQVPFANVVLVGLVIGAYAQLAWLVRGWRAVADRKAILLSHPFVGKDLEVTAGSSQHMIVAVRGLSRYHRADCPLAAARPVVTASKAVHETDGRQPCGICRP